MELQRVCNAGVLVTLDGISVLLDGLCEAMDGYLPTSPMLVQTLLDNPPDLLIFTHSHPDHFSDALLLPYKTQKHRPIFGPVSFLEKKIQVGEVTVSAVETRHLGKTEPGLIHHSFVIEGSKCIWFMGDASPMELKKMAAFPKPDVLIVPYAYANTIQAWEKAKQLCCGTVVVLHLPEKDNDPHGLWQQVEATKQGDPCMWIPQIGERKTL